MSSMVPRLEIFLKLFILLGTREIFFHGRDSKGFDPCITLVFERKTNTAGKIFPFVDSEKILLRGAWQPPKLENWPTDFISYPWPKLFPNFPREYPLKRRLSFYIINPP